MEREVPARGVDRSGRVAPPVGHRLPPAANLLPCRVAGPEGDLAQPAAAGAVPRARAGFPRHGDRRALVVLRESIRRHAAAEWFADGARDARQLGPEGRTERAL